MMIVILILQGNALWLFPADTPEVYCFQPSNGQPQNTTIWRFYALLLDLELRTAEIPQWVVDFLVIFWPLGFILGPDP